MSWAWKANCNVENPSVCFLLATTQFEYVLFSAEIFPGPGQPSNSSPRRIKTILSEGDEEGGDEEGEGGEEGTAKARKPPRKNSEAMEGVRAPGPCRLPSEASRPLRGHCRRFTALLLLGQRWWRGRSGRRPRGGLSESEPRASGVERAPSLGCPASLSGAWGLCAAAARLSAEDPGLHGNCRAGRGGGGCCPHIRQGKRCAGPRAPRGVCSAQSRPAGLADEPSSDGRPDFSCRSGRAVAARPEAGPGRPAPTQVLTRSSDSSESRLRAAGRGTVPFLGASGMRA